MIEWLLAAFAVAATAVVLRALAGLASDELKGWLPCLGQWLLRSAARRLPMAERPRWEEEWHAELEARRDRPLTALVFAVRVWMRARATAVELSARTPAPSRAHSQRDPQAPAPVTVDLDEKRREALMNLSYRERRVLELLHGLGGEHPRTPDEVGRTFNVTPERIRQIESQSVKKLQSLAEAQKLRDFP